MRYVLLISIMFYSINSTGKEVLIGDSVAVEGIKKITQEIYENTDKTAFYLTKKQLLIQQVYGIEISAYLNQGVVNRVIAKSMTDKGLLATEWYFSDTELIYAFESFEYFDETKEPEGWVNFKGLSAWESRYYFVNQKIKFQKHRGRYDVSEHNVAFNILQDGQAVLKYINQNQTEK